MFLDSSRAKKRDKERVSKRKALGGYGGGRVRRRSALLQGFRMVLVILPSLSIFKKTRARFQRKARHPPKNAFLTGFRLFPDKIAPQTLRRGGKKF